MIRLNSIIVILSIAIFGCDSDKTEPYSIPDGVYIGTFQRVQASGEAELAHVTITLYSGVWSGESDIIKYPALCYGTYQFYNHKIIFTNSCDWTAESDVSLILGGEFDFKVNGTRLEIIRSYPGTPADTWFDIYTLTFQKQIAFR